MEEVILPQTARVRVESDRLTGVLRRHWAEGVVLALALLLWLPRFSGPIDLRWDAGVYYLLGTSLATNHGYRIGSEPGNPEALQYPPLLPAVVALYQRVLGTTDPAVVGPWLRRSYAAVFITYGLSIFALARRYVPPPLALLAAAASLLHLWTIFLSDLLFAELPFALVSVLFVLVAASRRSPSRPWLREAAAFLLAATGFLLRTAGVALFVAWIFEALMRRCWRVALTRAVLAVLPILLWQWHVETVRGREEYRHPAYAYQRAAYQNYNVTYSENLRLVDPFRPELGRASQGALGLRVAGNLLRVPLRLGEAISAPRQFWQEALRHVASGRNRVVIGAVFVLVLTLGAVVIGGFIVLGFAREWLFVGVGFFSVALMCLTPWPEEFHRYLAPVVAFLAIAAMVACRKLDERVAVRTRSRVVLWTRLALAGLFALALGVQSVTAGALLLARERGNSIFTVNAEAAGARFFHGRDWSAWEEAVAWIGAHAEPGDIVATTAPHQVYLRIKLPAVYPPFEADPLKACRQLEAVPVKYVIIDEFKYRDLSRRYALPAVEADPLGWRIVYSAQGARVYEHTPARGHE